MERLNHVRAVLTKVFDHFETFGLVVCLVVIRNGIDNTHFDDAGFFVIIRVLCQFDKK